MEQGKMVIEYSATEAAISEMKDRFMALKVSGPEDIENYLIAKEYHQEAKQVLSDLEKERKKYKADIIIAGNFVDGKARGIRENVEPLRDHAAAMRAIVEDEKKRIKEEAIRKEQEEVERVKREEEARLESIRKEQEETARKQREAQDKLDADKRAVEEEKAKVELEKQRIEQEKVDAEKAKVKAEQDKKDAEEREKRHAEEVERAKEQAVLDENKRREAEQKAKDEEAQRAKDVEEHKKMMSPDKEKLIVFAMEVDCFTPPVVKTKEAQEILDSAVVTLCDIVEHIKAEANKL